MFVNNRMCVCVELEKEQKSYTEQMKCLFTSIPFISSVDVLITSQLSVFLFIVSTVEWNTTICLLLVQK